MRLFGLNLLGKWINVDSHLYCIFNEVKREDRTSLFYALNWYKFSEILPYNYGMRKGLYHV
nr:MAG TPA: hypothetical protein [Caudoviricetes sp.]